MAGATPATKGGGAGRRPAGARPKSGRPRDDDPFDQAAARRDLKRQASAANRLSQRSYDAALRGDPLPDGGDQGAYEAGVEERTRVAAGVPTPRKPPARVENYASPSPVSPSSPAPSAARQQFAVPQKVVSISQQGASFLVGLVGYALVLAYLDYGAPGVKSWLSAKFLNKPTLSPAGATGAAVGAAFAPAQPSPPVTPATTPGRV